MASFLWATFGLCLLKLCLTETQFNVSCRYGGVFHVEKNGRYSLSQPEAVELCRALNSTLATLEQLKKAHELGFETCRYGFVVGNIVIPRINPYHLCAANHTGIYKLSANTTGRYDAYCYNATETRDKACEPVERLDTSFLNNQGEIVIDNADGSRYTADGTRHSGESSTSGADDENIGSGSTHDTTPMDTSIRRSSPSYYGSVTPVSQLPDHSSGAGEREIHRKDSDDEVSPVSPDISLVTAADDVPEKDGGQYPASTTVAFPDGAYHEDPTRPPLSSDMEPGQGTEGSTHPTDAPGSEVLYSTTASTRKPGDDSSLTATITASTDVLKPQDITQEAWAPHIMVTAIASPDGGHHEDPTQPPLSSDMEPGQGTEGSTHPTDAPGNEVLYSTTASTRKPGDDSSLTATITESVDDVNREKATKEPQSPGTPPGSESEQANTTDSSHLSWVPGVFPDIEDHLNQLQTPLPTRSTSSIYGDQGPHKGHYESTTFPGDTTTTKIVSQRRSGQVPEWLIIVAALVALALILAVCIAVNSRRRCGQKKKLVINNGKGAVEDRKTSGLNGDASKSQEMVHLVHKEQSNDRTGACDEFLTINETQNHQEFDMKSGV
ncbi:CD44 antigen isoform X11 [Falco biarmicus]|uniref:CD44 antigen isoform X11 n=1 Tax=Falco cherrug TaxID=345164 RepID=UPI0018869C06|nr:CD44 antigen isoform X11 [Falco cherrug]XP_037251015.1 CD44 antigen isoform X8 [Falco rusticolus]XP_056201900.1 CD44 antigen isoform X11 [Falco biarmicus]